MPYYQVQRSPRWAPGDIGTSGTSAVSLNGFSLTPDTSSQFSQSPQVIGKIYASDNEAPTPAMITKAVSDMNSAYDEASTRIYPSVKKDRSAGYIGSTEIPPGLYKWNSDVNVTDGDLYLTGTSEEVWVFQLTQNLNIGTSTKIILSNGAIADNIFWQVAGQTTIGENSFFVGNILGKDSVTIKNGAVINGRIFTQGTVTLHSGAIKNPTAPIVQTPIIPTPTPVVTPVVATTPTSTTSPISTPSLQDQINALTITLQTLLTQAKQQGITVPTIPAVSSLKFTKNLFTGSRDPEVASLQTFLISKNVGVKAQALSSAGTSGYFGTLTKQALIEFQKNVGISPASGYFGPLTRTYISSL